MESCRKTPHNAKESGITRVRQEGVFMQKRYKVVCNIEFGDMFVQLLIWAGLFLITFGLASLFFPYYLIKLVLNNTELREVEGVTP